MSPRIPNNKQALLPLMISLVLFSQTAIAQDETEQLDTIQVEGKATDAGETLLDLQEIQRLNPDDLQDLFRSTPSVQVGSSLPASQKVYVNGIEETNLTVTVDGARQNNKLFHHSGSNIIDPELLKAVRVDAGVAPADAGPGALGGSIAYETKDVADLLKDGDNFGGAVGLEYNTNGDTFDRNISMYGRSGGFEVLGFVKQASGDEFDDGDGTEVLGSQAALKSGLFKVGYLHESGYRAKLSYEKVEDDGDRPSRANFITGTIADNMLERETVALSIKDETPEGFFNPYIKIARTHSKLEWNDSYPTIGEYESVNGVIANEFVLGMGTVDAGIDFYDDTSKGIFPTWNEYPEEKSRNIGAFAQARFAVTDRTRISFGARYDDHELEGVEGSKHDNDGMSGNISGEFDVTPFVTASAGYSHVFGGVQLAEPYIANPTWDYSAGLKESKADNGFIGLNINGEALSSTLTNFDFGVGMTPTVKFKHSCTCFFVQSLFV